MHDEGTERTHGHYKGEWPLVMSFESRFVERLDYIYRAVGNHMNPVLFLSCTIKSFPTHGDPVNELSPGSPVINSPALVF